MAERQNGKTPVLTSDETNVSAPVNGRSPAELIERRRRPRISTTPPAPPPPPKIDDYVPIIGQAYVDELRYLAQKLRGKTVKMVNSTSVGGGVAEILSRLIPLMDDLEVQTKWEVITGGNDFFEVTKAFHNALQGGTYNLTQEARETFLAYNEQNRRRMHFDEDFVVIHDPQPAGLIPSKANSHAKWIWRCHIDLSNPNPDVWGFLRPMIEQYDASIFSSPAFSRQLQIPQYLFYPCIDALSDKNKLLEESVIAKVCDDFGIDRSGVEEVAVLSACDWEHVFDRGSRWNFSESQALHDRRSLSRLAGG